MTPSYRPSLTPTLFSTGSPTPCKALANIASLTGKRVGHFASAVTSAWRLKTSQTLSSAIANRRAVHDALTTTVSLVLVACVSCCASKWVPTASQWFRDAALAPLGPSACVCCVINVQLGTNATRSLSALLYKVCGTRYAALFVDGASTMQQFMWQQDVIGVAHFVQDCFDLLDAPV